MYACSVLNVFPQQINTGKKQLPVKFSGIQKNHLDANGKVINYMAQNNTALKQMQLQGMNAIGKWEPVGPFNTGSGMGRVNCIAFIDADTWLVGTASGGLWKTDVAGIYNPNIPGFDKPWSVLTDSTGVTGVTGIAVKPSSPNKIYILTGDGDQPYVEDSLNFEEHPYGKTFPSTGILKTTDGGVTWSETALKFTTAENVIPHKLLMDPGNAKIMYAATSNGLYYTKDAWATYSLAFEGEPVWDVEMHPGNSKIIYISDDNGGLGTYIYKSSDGAASWHIILHLGSAYHPKRTSLAVCAAAPDNIYVAPAYEFGLSSIYFSTNKGNTFTQTPANQELLAPDEENVYKNPFGSPKYNLAFAVDPANPAKVMVGGTNIWGTYTLGISWLQDTHEESTGNDYVHKSIHAIEFNPYNGTIVCGTEGGLYTSPGNNDTYWEKRWAGMTIAQYNYFDVNNSSSFLATEIIGGAMDNGTDANDGAAIISSGTGFSPVDFNKVGKESGYNCFSGTEDETSYRYTEDGTGHLFLQKKDDFYGWQTSDISPDYVFDYDNEEGPSGNTGTALAVNPNHFSEVLYGGGAALQFSNDFGDNWVSIHSDNVYSPDIITWNKNNQNNIAFGNTINGTVIAVTNQFYLGIISGNYNWQYYDLTSLLGVDQISDLKFTDDAYPNNIVVTIPGYNDSSKVYRTMKDSTWKNISYNLPNVPVLCAEVDEYGIYVGTDIGVFFLADKDSVWSYFSKGLPTVPVTRIEEVQDIIGRRVYCSTYGRGIWKGEPAPPKRVTRYYVNKAATGTNTGLNWTDAFTKVQDAIYQAIPGDSIWVAQGTYYPTASKAITGGSAARLYTFIVDSNTVIYGGFYGNETRLEQRNADLYKTILSGNLGDTSIATDNAYHVLTILNSTKNSLIDGFTIRDGYANGSTSYPSLYRGGAILLAYDSTNAGRPFFRNCSFASNLAAQGGAFYISQYFKSDLKTSFLKCSFSQNHTYSNGFGERGGAICTDASPASNGPFGKLSLMIDSCIFQYNNSPNGGAIYNEADNTGTINFVINNTQFLHNKSATSAGYGGAITNYTYNKGKLNLTLNGCTFLDDDAPNAGGSIYNAGSSTLNDDDMQVYINNCSFDSCSGYAVYSTGGKIFLSADKSTFTNNSGGILHVGATIDGLSFGKITNCTFNNSVTGINLACNNSGSGSTNKSANYSIDSCTFINNSYGLYVYNYSQGQNAKHVQYTLSHSTFTSNTSGAVYNFGSDNCNITATLKKNTFTNNKGTNGGAIYSNGTANNYIELYIDSCNFTGNKASASGGALYNYNTDIVSVNKCNFTNDTAASGGAAYNYRHYFSYHNCTYTNNVSTGSGGAMFFTNDGSEGMNTDIINNIFNGNKAANYGGSLYAYTAASGDTLNINIDSCSFNNSTTTLNTTQSHGGAVYLNAAAYMNANIKHTDFTNNHAKSRGGAIYAQSTTGRNIKLSLNNCNFDNNVADTYGGGICYGDGTSNGKGSLLIDSCTLHANSASVAQGGLSIYHSSGDTLNVNLSHCIFDANNTQGYAGGLYIGANGTVNGTAADCMFKNNTAVTDGGAARLYASQLKYNNFKFKNCLFNNNSAPGHGGAAYIQTDVGGKINSAFENCVFVNNSSGYGAGLYVSATSSQATISVPVTNCTIATNNATTETGGIYVTRTSTPPVKVDLTNTILWGNTDAAATANKKQAYISGGALGFVKNSIIKDSIPFGYADSGLNVFIDPLFINATDIDGFDNIFATTDDGLSIEPGSPAIDAGAIDSLTKDITGLSRPQGSGFDIGAYETTGCSMGKVSGLTLGKASSCRLQYTWTAMSGAANYETQYKQTSSGTWIAAGNVTATQQTVINLTPNTSYDFRVRAKNGSCKGKWTLLLNKSTVQYDEPDMPSESNITSTSAKLKWKVSACGGAIINYTLKYKEASSSSWITVDVTDISYKATGLLPATQYNWKVRANYSDGNSAYTTIRNFNTLADFGMGKNGDIGNQKMNVGDKPSLQQNIPNPFRDQTTINYYLPVNNTNAYINFYGMNGALLKSIRLAGSGKGNISLKANELPSGTYRYALIVDGKIVDSKQMILAR